MRRFSFNGIRGMVDAYGYVTWGGMGFHLYAADPELRKAIMSAR